MALPLPVTTPQRIHGAARLDVVCYAAPLGTANGELPGESIGALQTLALLFAEKINLTATKDKR